MAKAQVRGIYSTALTKLLLDNHFEIVQPSIRIKKRFNLEESKELPDLVIYDRRNRQGVYARGKAESIDTFCSILRSRLDDAVIRKWPFTIGVEFPALSKARLDEIRRAVTPTMKKHHFYKACGGRVSVALEMAEKLLKKGYAYRDVEELFKQTVEREYPTVESLIEIEHVKLNGKVFHLGKALIQNLDHKGSTVSVRFRRDFMKKGMYDGLKTPKEPDDYAITEVKIGEWHFKTQYFSKDGQPKGTYVNLNTPVELYPYGIRYVDLEVDVCMWPNGRVEKLDEEKLEKAIDDGLVSEKLVKIVREKLVEVIENLHADKH